MRIKWYNRVGEAEVIPRGYGVVYEDYARAEWIVLPIPFNLVARFALLIYWRIMRGIFYTRYERRMRDALNKEREKGWQVGRNYGYQLGWQDGQRALEQAINKRLDDWLAMSMEERAQFKGWNHNAKTQE